jgi:hypothetical protein
MKVFRSNCNEEKRNMILNIHFLIADESFLFSNLNFAVLYMILLEVFDCSYCCPTSKIQFLFCGDPLQNKCFDKNKLNIRKLICGFSGITKFAETEGVSALLAALIKTGLKFLFLSKFHRTEEVQFMSLCNKVKKNYDLFNFSYYFYL